MELNIQNRMINDLHILVNKYSNDLEKYDMNNKIGNIGYLFYYICLFLIYIFRDSKNNSILIRNIIDNIENNILNKYIDVEYYRNQVTQYNILMIFETGIIIGLNHNNNNNEYEYEYDNILINGKEKISIIIEILMDILDIDNNNDSDNYKNKMMEINMYMTDLENIYLDFLNNNNNNNNKN